LVFLVCLPKAIYPNCQMQALGTGNVWLWMEIGQKDNLQG